MVTIGKRTIGRGNPVFIVLEAGPTHEGIESAKKLVDIAKDAGADAIKFQMMDVDRLMADKEINFSYNILLDKTDETKVEKVEESLYKILKRRELSKAQWKELKLYCQKKEIEFFSTAMFPEEVDFLVDELEVSSIKLASADINYVQLIEHIAKKNVNIQVDTGSADIWEIERLITLVERHNNQNIIIHLCPTGYPAVLESIHLNMIPLLKQMFPKYGIAFSDHSPGWEIDIAAVALGVNLIEKTITLDRTTRSCEHMFSLERENAISFVKSIKKLEKALGQTRRVIPLEVKESRKIARRSAYLKKELEAGTAITLADIDFRRPGFGIAPDEWLYAEGKTLNKTLKPGDLLRWEDLK
ncbi:N-acetylneuraminate synthase family protein [Peptococcaceae bacterium 1198_IL3148]